MLRHDAQTWERFLWTSGGLLNLGKCAFYILTLQFDDEGRATYIPKLAIPDVHLTSGNQPGTPKVQKLNYNETHKYLGYSLSISMQMTQAFTSLYVTAHSYSSRILSSNLTRRDTWVAYFTVFVPSMGYTLSVSYHSPRKLRKIQLAATQATLMKLGFNRNTAHRDLYGPSQYGGLGFRDLFVEQGIGQEEMLVRYLRVISTQGTIMRITLSWWELVAGVSFPLLEAPSHLIPHLGPHWLSTLRYLLTMTNALLHIEGFTETLPPPLRENDDAIMDVIVSLSNVSKPDLRAYSRCNIYYGVTHLSEIASADGSLLARDAWDRSRLRISPTLWPYQPKPGPKSFRVW
jgi:hypothetical protein